MAEIRPSSVVTIVDYGMGNLGSIRNMFRKVGVESCIATTPAELESATKILLPGVGAFDAAVQAIDGKGFRDVLNQKALVEKVPVLGICLGMQLLLEGSEEGVLPGLGWIPGRVCRFPRTRELPVPHMGWNIVTVAQPTPLTAGLDQWEELRYYFVHSYFAWCTDRSHSLFRADYGVQFDAGVHRENISGVQFHPEKSHKFGMALLRNFGGM